MHEESPEGRERTRRLLEEYRRRFSGDPLVVRAPGRVNLIGEHTDYNDGFVLPIAIDLDVRFAVGQRNDHTVHLYSLDFERETVFSLDDVRKDDSDPWGNYVRGMAVELTREGRRLHGMHGVVQGNVPIASGLSSSAATEVAAGLAFLAISKEVVEPPLLAQIAQRAENQFMGVRVGIMDQFISRLGHTGCALFLDCRSLQYDLVPVPGDEYLFVVADSRQSRELAGSAYNERRSQCEAAVVAIRQELPHVKALRDVTPEDLQRFEGGLDPVVFRRARHVVTENARVLQAVEALKGNDLPRFGQLMNASHDSLRDDYQVSSDALDVLVNAARQSEGCLGSRLTGAGFGGCTVSLVRQDRVESFCRQVRETYARRYHLEVPVYPTRPAAGAGLVPIP